MRKANSSLARRSLSYARCLFADRWITCPNELPISANMFRHTTKVATVVRINPLRVRIDIPEQAIPEVRVGQSVSVTTSAWPDKNFSGRIARISPNVTPTSRTLTVEAEIENSSGDLKPGQFATVRILQSRASRRCWCRRVLCDRVGRQPRVRDQGRHAPNSAWCRLGQTEGDLVEIKSGVAADENVATSNVEQLSDGIAVKTIDLSESLSVVKVRGREKLVANWIDRDKVLEYKELSSESNAKVS